MAIIIYTINWSPCTILLLIKLRWLLIRYIVLNFLKYKNSKVRQESFFCFLLRDFDLLTNL